MCCCVLESGELWCKIFWVTWPFLQICSRTVCDERVSLKIIDLHAVVVCPRKHTFVSSLLELKLLRRVHIQKPPR